MPQFDTTFFSSQIFWTIISFVLLFVVLSRWVLPRIASILQERTRLIEQEIEEARQKREEVEELRLDYAEKLSSIDSEAKKLFDESEKRILERRSQLMGEWKEEMERRKREFREESEVARQKAIREIRAQSAELVVEAAEKVIHQRLDEREARQILEETIEDMERHPPKKS
ncbi:ATP synthase F0 subcomplex B subunit [Mariprofundus ferrinatatus]|uniref:ATP synthase subunit b n=1 Tax=Mariprofundus ferrinatatus TaxID=1921087 RepID=A0A2K8L9N7_9PROT|nr:F0F1 ATP synthase subunit B [Mariprofundus ferrinatatus]ATX82601.1 ATP synthase F0 subcomplex B subunit [Mariprofundus ferrinatatus]